MNIDELLDRADLWLQICPACDAGMAMSCVCPPGDPRNLILDLVHEIERLTAQKDQT